MSIDSIDVDLETVFNLDPWLQSDPARPEQRQLEEKITNMLFSQDATSPVFQSKVAQLASIGFRPEIKSFLEKEILILQFPPDYCAESRSVFKKIGSFIADHVVEIAVGVAICATGVGIAIATGYTISATVGGVVVAGSGSFLQSEEKPNPHIPRIPLPDPKACSQAELAAIQRPFSSTRPQIELPSSLNEVLITADGVWANGQFFSTNVIREQSIFSSPFQQNTLDGSLGFSRNSRESDWRTFHTYLYGQQETNDLSYQALGENALALGNYQQAIHDLGKAIEANPTDPLSYLERGAAHLNLGEYDRSLEDYQQFISKTETTKPLSVSDFCFGFAKGLPKGTYESGEGIFLFLVDFSKHPIQTSKQVVESITVLVDLVRKDEWGAIAEALSPEMHQLVTQWDSLPSEKRGELAGYAVGKHGADILLPGALAKVASKSVKSAQELIAVCKNLQIVQETLILETAAGIGNSAKIAEVLEAGQKTALFAEELGITAPEMGQLKQAGKLEQVVANTLEEILKDPALKESYVLFKKAENFLETYGKKFMPEPQIRDLIHQAGIRTFPRPVGIPENFRVRLSDGGAGMLYVHPEHTHISIRVMPGKPHSPNPSQQKPYVVYMKNGKAFDSVGNIVNKNTPEAHIPFDEFVYRD